MSVRAIFLLTTYLRFCVAFARLCSISKDLLARWKTQQRLKITQRETRRLCSYISSGDILMILTGETTDWVLF